MSSEVYNLAILLSIKDAASGGLDRFAAKLRAADKDGKQFAETFDSLREEMNKGLAIGGVGLAGLGLLNNGIKSAATYEDALFELRRAFQENTRVSGKSREAQEVDFKKLTALATDLGAKLQGSTADYINILTALNKAGIDATATLNGTGEAVAYLANVTGAIRKGTSENLAEDFGSFVKAFALTNEKDLRNLVNAFAAIDDRFNLQSSALIEGSKYFALTAKSTMNLEGYEGAVETMKLMAFMKRFTMREGSVAGTSLDNLIGQYISHLDKVQKLEKQTGIKLALFDDKGQFKGATPEERVKTLFAELNKLQALNPLERASWMKTIFGEVGFEAATAISEQGLQGWQEINNEMAKSVDAQTQINQQMDTYNAKMEALSGSWDNLKATAFTPLMDSTKGLVDSTADIVNWLQKVSDENPNLTKVLTTIAAYGSSALVVVGGFKAMTSAWKMFQLASAFSRGDNLLSYLNNVSTATGTATTQVGKLKGTVQTIANSSALKVGIQVVGVMAAEIALTSFLQKMQEVAEESQKLAENSKEVERIYNSMMGQGLLFNKVGDYSNNKSQYEELASKFLESAKMNRQLFLSFHPDQASLWERWSFTQPYGADLSNPFGNNKFKPEHAVATWRQAGLTQPLHDPNVLAQVISQIQKGGGDLSLTLEDTKLFLQALEKTVSSVEWKAALDLANKDKGGATQQPTAANKEVFNFLGSFNKLFPQQENKILNPLPQKTNQNPFDFVNSAATDFFKPLTPVMTSLGNLSQPANELPQRFLVLGESSDKTKQNVVDFGDTLSKTQSPLTLFITATSNASGGLDALSNKLANWIPPIPIGQSNGTGEIPLINAPSKASGGRVKSKGLAYIHTGEEIVPANVTSKYELPQNSGNNQPITIQYSPQVTVNGGDKDAEQKFRAMLYDHKKDIERIMMERLEFSRIRG